MRISVIISNLMLEHHLTNGVLTVSVLYQTRILAVLFFQNFATAG